jgi:hypothetical protein
VVALVAVRRASWRLPVLVFLVLQFALHTINHLVDIDEAAPQAVGVFDFAALAIATALLALLITRARERVPPEHGAGR